MSSSVLIALASLLTALGAAGAAIVAAYALRSQQRGEQRQHDLENHRWITDQFRGLAEMRRRAALSLLEGDVDEFALREILNFFESAAYLVRERFISERTYAQIGRVAAVGWWHASEPAVLEARAHVGPDLFDHFEWLKDRMQADGFVANDAFVEGYLRREAGLPILQNDAMNESVSATLSGDAS